VLLPRFTFSGDEFYRKLVPAKSKASSIRYLVAIQMLPQPVWFEAGLKIIKKLVEAKYLAG
jgi:hypothetical protein